MSGFNKIDSNDKNVIPNYFDPFVKKKLKYGMKNLIKI